MSDDFEKYDVMPPEMDMSGPSRREAVFAALLIAGGFLFVLACIIGTIMDSR